MHALIDGICNDFLVVDGICKKILVVPILAKINKYILTSNHANMYLKLCMQIDSY